MNPGDRRVLHVDMNAFFASVEQRDNPALRGRPVVVSGGLSRRGLVLTASYEARPYGIKTGMRLFEAQALCPGLVVVEGHYKTYTAVSRQLGVLLEQFTPWVEMTSCDEAYLDLTDGTPWSGARARGERVRDVIRKELNLPCSVGVAPNKLLAKLASDMKKPNGVTVIPPDQVKKILKNLPVESLCGIGPRMKKNLDQMGVTTCGQLEAMDFETLYTRFGVWGHWLKRMGSGIDDTAVARVDDPSTVKSVGHETTFPANTQDPELLRSYLLLLCEKVGARLRRYGLSGREVNVRIRDDRFRSVQRHRLLGEAVFTDEAIYATAVALLEEGGPPPRPVRLLGVSVGRVEPLGNQGSLFDSIERPRRLAETVDRLNTKSGRGFVSHARTALARKKGVLDPPVPPALKAAD